VKIKTMKSITLKFLFPVFLTVLLSSCAGTVQKMYEGDPLDPSEIAFVTTPKGLFICSVDGQNFYATVPVVTLCHRNIEVIGPHTYKIRAWNGHAPQKESNTVDITFEAEPGKLYKVYYQNESSHRLPASLREVTDPEEIKLFYTDLANGKVKRELPSQK
jgi:hypothetical protein